MFKKIFLVMMCSIMLSANVLANETVESVDSVSNEADVEKETTVYTLSLEDAINIAMTDNPQLKACIAKKDDTQIQLKAAKETKSQYRELTNIPITSAYELVYIKNGYYVHSYEKALELSDYEYRQIEAQIAYNVTEKYFNLKNCEKLVEISHNSYNLVSDNYKNAELSYELGMISKAEFDSSRIALMQTEFALESQKKNLEIAKEDFKIVLRKNNEDCDFILTSELTVTEFETNLSEDLITAENSRYDITALKTNLELAKEYLDLTMDAHTARNSSAQYSYITAEYNYTNNKSLIMLGIKASYNNISTTRNNVTLTGENLNLKNNLYEIAKIQYEQGLITNTELTSKLIDIYTAEIEHENSKLSYMLAVNKYKYDIQIGL